MWKQELQKLKQKLVTTSIIGIKIFEKNISGPKQKKWKSSSNSGNSKLLNFTINKQCSILDQIRLKR